MQSQSRTPKSMRTSDRSLESLAWGEVRKLQVRRESKRRREFRGPTFPSGHKAARRCNRFVAIPGRAALRALEDRPSDQRRLIQLGKLWRTPEQVRSFVDRNKTCT